MSLHIVSVTWWSHKSLGTVLASKYSVMSIEPLGSESQVPSIGRSPDFEHTVAEVMPLGVGKSLYSSPS